MMEFFPWHSGYETGFATIDRQHRRLVGILNEFYLAMHRGQAHEALQEIFDRLVDFAGEHFAWEEHCMRRSDYPGYAAHKAQHDALRAKVMELQAGVRGGAEPLTLAVGRLLKDWLNEHILETDMAYRDCMREAGID